MLLCEFPIHAFINTYKQIHAISPHDSPQNLRSLYMPVYICMYAIYAVYVCIIAYIDTYKQIQTVIFVHMLCYIHAYFVYIFVYIRSYMLILLICVHIFCSQIPKSNNMSAYEHICTYMNNHMHIYARMHTLYMHDTCNIQACFSYLLHVICKS